MRRVVELLGHWLWARLALLAIAGLVLLPDLGGAGLWEPQELAVADRAVARAEKAAGKTPQVEPARPVKPRQPAAAPTPAPAATSGGIAPSAPPAPTVEEEVTDEPEEPAPGPAVGPCPKSAPTDTGARTLTEQLAARDTTDRGMRLPLAILALLTVAGAAGIGFRLGGTRAGLFAGIVCLSFPLLALQGRQLTSELGGPAGATLIVYGLAFAIRPARGTWVVVDAIGAAIALAAGTWLAFLGSGALLGVLVPFGAFALAGKLGWPVLRQVGRLAGDAAIAAHDMVRPRERRLRPPAETIGGPQWLVPCIAIVATAAAIVVAVILASEMYAIRDPIPGTRSILGKSVVPADCWSSALGGLWKFDDNLAATYDVSLEQIAFGTFPWGLAAPLAIGILLASRRREHRFAGALTLAWAGGTWLASIAFQRKVGFAIYTGFPAMAVAVGLYLDHLLDRLGDATIDADGPRLGLLAGLFVLLGAITLGKDLQTFPERLTSLLVGHDAIKYPKAAHLLGLPLRAWVMTLGVFIALAFALALWTWRGGDTQTARNARGRARLSLLIALGATAILAAFWTHGWHRVLSHNLSSKQVFATYRALRQDGDVLGILGEMGNAPRYYAGGSWQKIANRDQLMPFLQRTDGKRAFALAPGSELCAFHRAAGGKSFYVVDDSNTRTLLLSNRLDQGVRDRNPLADTMLRAEPAKIPQRAPGKIAFGDTGDRIELIGWKLPARVDRGDDFEVELYFRVVAPVIGAWKVFVHFDPQAAAQRLTADHDPLNNRCATSLWQKGDYIVDRFTVDSGKSSASGPHTVYVGFWPGGERERMKVTDAPGGTADENRVRIGTVILQ